MLKEMGYIKLEGQVRFSYIQRSSHLDIVAQTLLNYLIEQTIKGLRNTIVMVCWLTDVLRIIEYK